MSDMNKFELARERLETVLQSTFETTIAYWSADGKKWKKEIEEMKQALTQLKQIVEAWFKIAKPKSHWSVEFDEDEKRRVKEQQEKPKVGDIELEKMAEEVLRELGKGLMPHMTRIGIIIGAFKKLLSQAQLQQENPSEWDENEKLILVSSQRRKKLTT